jgi:hypothetical protein
MKVTYGLIVSHQETISCHDMGVEGGPESRVNCLRNSASHFANWCFVDGVFVDIVGTNTGLRGFSEV